MNQSNIVLCALLGFVAWYYYTKLQETKQMYIQARTENIQLKARVKDLQSYKTDVSKTFQILDNELGMIHTYLNKQNNVPELNNNQSMGLLLNSLLTSMNTDDVCPAQLNNEMENEHNWEMNTIEDDIQHIESMYDKCKIEETCENIE